MFKIDLDVSVFMNHQIVYKSIWNVDNDRWETIDNCLFLHFGFFAAGTT